MSSLSDILTALKNGVIGINNVAQNTRIASTTSSTVPAATTTLIYQGSGRLFNYSVVVAGSTAGAIYDSATTGLRLALDFLSAKLSASARHAR